MSTTNTTSQGRFAPAMEARVGRIVSHAAAAVAVLGGFILVAIVILTVTSITGRALLAFGMGPVPGDFELVEAGTAFAVFAFLPWCQLQRGHVTVDIIMQKFGPKAMVAAQLVGNILMALISSIILWRFVLGLLDKRQYHETTFILQFPVWWSFLAACLGGLMFCIVSYYTIWRSANELTGSGDIVAGPVVH